MGDYNLHQHPHPCNELGSDDRRLSTDSVSVWRRSFVMGHGDEEGSSGGRAADGWRSDGLPPLSKTGGGEMSSGCGDGRNSGRNIDPNMDPRKLKRIMSNRVSAQKSRLKKVQYVADMERKLKALEAHIAVLSPQVELFRNQQHVLQMEQKRLNQKILNCSRNKLIQDAEIEENKAEVNRLRELQMKQQQQSEGNAWDNNAFQMPPPELQASELSNLVSPRPNQAEDGERTVGGNGLGRFNSTALRRMIEYKWMPTPGLRQGFEPNSNLLGQQGMEKPN
ncbi:basic leucine zipper 19-like isoform X1 [Cucurbita moschata]|uniref:Basic leucine zipper 19-like isoform X1 n=1 Tax=Cucurbita moschata TaxID=3662 RepID=A0A6J1HPF0_CUCMO|nr:basic leucine zipper 19-like isoform X1 [Cucurbita moschata]